MSTVASESQKLYPEGKIKLLTITYTGLTPFRFAVGGLDPLDTITFDGNTYFARQFSVGGLTTSGGKLPRPSLSIDNVDRYWYSFIATYDELNGAAVNYKEIYRENLDDGNDPDAAELLSDYDFIIYQMDEISRQSVNFTLATNFDLEQVKFGRPCMKRGCRRPYRSPDANNTDTFFYSRAANVCPYGIDAGTGSNYFTKDGTSTSDWREDDCGGDLADCVLRFGSDVDLPIQVFPGMDQNQT